MSLLPLKVGQHHESATATNTTNTSTAAAATGTENTAGPNPTIATHVQENLIQQTPIHGGDRRAPNINQPVPEGWADDDMHEVIRRILDEDEFLEIQSGYAQNVVIGFGRIERRSVGIVANQPTHFAG